MPQSPTTSEDRRRPLFITSALRSIERGELTAASFTLIEGYLRRSDVLRERFDEALDLLARTLAHRGQDRELLDLARVSLGLGLDLFMALAERLRRLGRSEVIAYLELLATKLPPVSSPALGPAAVEPALVGAPTQATSFSEVPWAVAPLDAAGQKPTKRSFARRPSNTRLSKVSPEAPSAESATPPRRTRGVSGELPRVQLAKPVAIGAAATRGVSVNQCDAWLRKHLSDDVFRSARYGSKPAARPTGPKKARTKTAVSQHGETLAPLRSHSSREELLAVAAQTFGRDGEQRQAERSLRRTRQLRVAVMLLVLLCAGTTFGLIGWQLLEHTWYESELRAAEQQANQGTMGGLQRARTSLLSTLDLGAMSLEAHPESDRALGMAFFIDRVLVDRYGDAGVSLPLANHGAAIHRTPWVRLGLMLDALSAGDVALARSIFDRTGAEIWARDPGTREWAAAWLALADDDGDAAALAFTEATKVCALGTLPLMELADLAIDRDGVASRLFLEQAKAVDSRNLFVWMTAQRLSEREDELDVLEPLWQPEQYTASQSAWVALFLGERAMNSGDWRRAERDVAAAGEVAHADLALLAGRVAIERGAPDEAAAHFVRGLKGLAGRPRADARAAEIEEMLLERGQAELALMVVETSLGLEGVRGGRFEALHQLNHARALMGLGRWGALRTLVEQDPSPLYAVAREQLAARGTPAAPAPILPGSARGLAEFQVVLADLQSRVRNGSFKEALDVASRVSTAHPDRFVPLQLRGELLSLAGRADEAASLADLWRRGHLSSARASLSAALFMARAGTLTDDLAAQSAALEVTDVDLLATKAEIAARRGDLDSARTSVERVLEADPNHPRARAVRGLWLSKKGGAGRLQDLEAGLQGQLTLPNVGIELARELGRAGHTDRAIAVLEGALERPAEQLAAVEALAELYIASKQPKKGRSRLEKVLAGMSQDSENRVLRGHMAYWLGRLYAPSEGNYASAKYLKMARLLLGEQPDILYYLGEYFWARGNHKIALDFFRQANEIDPSYALAAKALQRS